MKWLVLLCVLLSACSMPLPHENSQELFQCLDIRSVESHPIDQC